MRLFKIEYTLVGDLQLAVNPYGSGSPVSRQRFLSVLLASDNAQALEAILAWRSEDYRGKIWNPRLEDVLLTSYYAASGGALEEVRPLSHQRPLLIGTESPQEIHVASR